MSCDLVRGEPSACKNNGPCDLGRIAKYANTAVTGHIVDLVLPMYKVCPCQMGLFYFHGAVQPDTWGYGGECPLG